MNLQAFYYLLPHTHIYYHPTIGSPSSSAMRPNTNLSNPKYREGFPASKLHL